MMYTKDFLKELKSLGFYYKHENNEIRITDGIELILSVSEDQPYEIIKYFPRFYDYTYDERREFMSLVWQYISTPVDLREPEKKYIYHFPFYVAGGYADYYIVRAHWSYPLDAGDVGLDNSGRDYALEDSMFHFTESEIKRYSEEDQALFKICRRERVE